MTAPKAVPDISLRPALDDDREFLLRVYASSRAEELAPVLWTPEETATFLAQQFAAQDYHYRTHYIGAEFLVVEVDGRAAGRLYVHRTDADILVLDIALLPTEQKRGIGTRLLTGLVSEADQSGRSMSLHVEFNNPALRLYRRLGFEVMEELGVYWRLERAPAETTSASS